MAGLWLALLGLAAAHGPQDARYLHFNRTATAPAARRLQDASWRPIRIYLDTSALEQQVPTKTAYLREVLQAAGRWLSATVRVLPVQGNLKYDQHCSLVSMTTYRCARVADNFQECGETTIPREHFADKEYCPSGKLGGCSISPGGDGIPDADLGIYVTAVQTAWCTGNTVAYASACRQAEDDRPVAGYFNFCRSRLGEGQWHQDVATSIHEILHSMGFSSSLFAFFRDEQGEPRTARDDFGMPPVKDNAYRADSTTVREETVDGQLRHFLVLPTVLRAARQHFGCSGLAGVPMEEQGGDGSAGSHWDARVMHTEVMAAESSAIPRVSDLTLALLQDSGWYRVHGGAGVEGADSAAGPFFFGKGKGCGFLQDKCIVDGQSAFPDTFCTQNQGHCADPSAGSVACSQDHMSVGTCTNCLHSENLPAMYQHFANPRLGGISQYVGYCPTVEPFWSGGRPTFCQQSGAFSATTSQRYGESVGSFSRCILSTATQQGYIQPPEPLGTCRNVYCEEGGLRIQISAENFVYCTPAEVGQRKDVYGQFAGHVLCPSVELLCPGGPSSKPCAFPGTMRHGRCVCAPGFMGADCSVRDLAVNREDYPYGLRYPQQEFVLKAGVPLALIENLAAWPVGPQLLDAPKVLQFRVAPDLPLGLSLQDGGVIDGTALVAQPRTAHVIEAFSWTGSSSTVIFITVTCEVACPEPTGTTSRSPMSTSGSEGPVATGKLSLALAQQFRQLQQDPGLGIFAEQLKVAFAATLSVQLVEVVVTAAPDGRVVVEAAVTGSSETMEERLRTQLQNSGSPLLTSPVGSYLQTATVTSISDAGATQVWPEPTTTQPMVWLDPAEWQDWLSMQPLVVRVGIIGGATVILIGCILVCCRQTCCCRKSAESAFLRNDMEQPRTPTNWVAPTPLTIGQPRAAHSTPAQSPDQAMEQMLGMGFPFDLAKVSLEAHGWDASRASMAILEGRDLQVESATASTDTEEFQVRK